MIIGTLRAEEARVFSNDSGVTRFAGGIVVEIFWHNGGHMIEAEEGDDMPLDDWRDPERPGWYYRYLNRELENNFPVGPHPTSTKALAAVRDLHRIGSTH